MIRKLKHPKGRGERLAIKTKKARIHSNASPVYKLLKEREDIKKDINEEVESRLQD